MIELGFEGKMRASKKPFWDKRKESDRDLNMATQNVPLGYTDYFELKAIAKQQMQKHAILELPLSN